MKNVLTGLATGLLAVTIAGCGWKAPDNDPSLARVYYFEDGSARVDHIHTDDVWGICLNPAYGCTP